MGDDKLILGEGIMGVFYRKSEFWKEFNRKNIVGAHKSKISLPTETKMVFFFFFMYKNAILQFELNMNSIA